MQANLELPQALLPENAAFVDNLALTAQGSGSLTNAELEGTLTGSLLDEALNLSFDSSFADNTIKLKTQGNILSGTTDIDMSYALEKDLSGTISFDSVIYQSILLNTSARLLGTLDAPRLTLSGNALVGNAFLEEISASVIFDEPVPVRFDGNLGLDSASANLHADALGGSIALTMQYDENTRLAGTVDAQSLSWQGFSVAGNGDIRGTLTQPELALQTSMARDEQRLEGSVGIVGTSITVNQVLDSSFISEPLTLTGNVFPALNLDIRNPQDQRLNITGAFTGDTVFQSSGTLNLAATGTDVSLIGGQNDALLTAQARVNAVSGLGFETSLPTGTLNQVIERVRTQDIQLEGIDNTSGIVFVSLENGFEARSNALSWQTDVGTLQTSATVRLADGLTADLSGTWQSADVFAESITTYAPWINELEQAGFNARLEQDQLSLNVETSIGGIQAAANLSNLSASLNANLTPEQGTASASVTYTRDQGPSGTLALANIPVLLETDVLDDLTQGLNINGTIKLEPEQISGSVNLAGTQNLLRASGSFGLARFLPSSIAPLGTTNADAELRPQRAEYSQRSRG